MDRTDFHGVQGITIRVGVPTVSIGDDGERTPIDPKLVDETAKFIRSEIHDLQLTEVIRAGVETILKDKIPRRMLVDVE